MDPAFDAFDPRCPSREVFDEVVGRWPTLVLVSLLDNPRRFAETARVVGGISDRMLARTLARLVAIGLVVRTEEGGQKVSYDLTASGRRVARSLRDTLDTLYAVMPDLPAGHTA